MSDKDFESARKRFANTQSFRNRKDRLVFEGSAWKIYAAGFNILGVGAAPWFVRGSARFSGNSLEKDPKGGPKEGPKEPLLDGEYKLEVFDSVAKLLQGNDVVWTGTGAQTGLKGTYDITFRPNPVPPGQ